MKPFRDETEDETEYYQKLIFRGGNLLKCYNIFAFNRWRASCFPHIFGPLTRTGPTVA